jgi:hypothetical protein
MTQLLKYSAQRKATGDLSDDCKNNHCLCNTIKYRSNLYYFFIKFPSNLFKTKLAIKYKLTDFEFVNHRFYILVFIVLPINNVWY